MIALLLAGLLTTAPAQDSPRADSGSDLRGVAGICVRWDKDHTDRVAEARVVESSGSRRLDRTLTGRIPHMDWPIEDNNHGQWLGIYMAVGGATAPTDKPLPDCSALPDHSWPVEPTPASGS